MSKPKTFRTAASMILVTTALAWSLPVRADDMRIVESEQESLVDTTSPENTGALRLPATGEPADAAGRASDDRSAD